MDLAHEYLLNVFSNGDICGFNPCFNGSCSRIRTVVFFNCARYTVSILVLMDLAHELYAEILPVNRGTVSILVLMDLAHE